MQFTHGSLSVSIRKVYGLAWEEFSQSAAVRRSNEDRSQTRRNDVVHFIMSLVDMGLSAVNVTIISHLAGVAFYRKFQWEDEPLAGQMGKHILDGWSRERCTPAKVCLPITLDILKQVIVAARL
ncbi:hypothetical protein NDU88_001238 [Pleurodeles waltl]|uniref:Uncharacterized protein n=1 Tax=Pleurodeles waltl TaxID=8319 RepID=A0AAV7SYM4_PLEWA|nr:hypothetical protein NDU88_001238 [Pleurodeles waltl]